MKQHRGHKGVLQRSALIAALLITIFATELAVMELLSPLFSRLDVVPAALIDATVVLIVSAVPLWFFFVRPLPPQPAPVKEGPPPHLLAETLAGIFLSECLIMLAMPQLIGITGVAAPVLDAALTTVAASCFIWRFLGKLQKRVRSRPLLETPLRLYVLLLCTLFLAGLLEEVLLHDYLRGVFGGSVKIAEAVVVMLCGAPLLWLLVVRPLRSEVRSEKARVAAVHAQLIDAVVVLDATGVITSVNPAAERLFGCRPGDMIGSSAARLFEEGERGLDGLMAAVEGSPPEEPSRLLEIRCRRCDGLLLDMYVSISEVLIDEEEPDYLLIMRDITARKEMERALVESETRFREIFHQSEDAIVFFKAGGCTPVDVNAKAEAIFGYRREEMLKGALELIAAPQDLPVLAHVVAGIDGAAMVQRDFSARRVDGTQIVVSMRGKTMILRGVPVTYCTFRDVTERVRTEERTREIQAKLIQANKMTSLGLLVSGVAHEINNPNNVIMANAELLTRISKDALELLKEYGEERGEGEPCLAGLPMSELREQWLRLLEGIRDGSHRVNDIVDNLKRFARQERGQQWREVDLNQVARSAVSLMHHELIKFTNHFHLELAERLPPVIGHGQQLGQVIINLLMNACQALPGRDRGVWLSTGFDAGRGEVVIAVRDEGGGISPEQGQRIMEQFFTTKLDSGGTGLGLSISESIVKEHGGRLEFDSQPGRGSSFFVRIPLAGQPARRETTDDGRPSVESGAGIGR